MLVVFKEMSVQINEKAYKSKAITSSVVCMAFKFMHVLLDAISQYR